MLYNVLDSSENVIGHVEANNPVEAWAKAREIYEATGSMVFDVRLSKTMQHVTTERPPHVLTGMERIEKDLRSSMLEEDNAVTSYRERAEFARRYGDDISARLWEHIAEEESGHYNEFKDRLGAL